MKKECKLKFSEEAENRFQLWHEFINCYKLQTVLELGVYKGEFAEQILKNCKMITQYKMIDPWKNLSDWNKPANTGDHEFEEFYKQTIERTRFAEEKISILRGKTTEVINLVEDKSLDFVYIDGDHTLRGITIDLVSLWQKVKVGGFIAGDDFCSSIWQHSNTFEPTFVFPFAVYFAEAKGVKIFALPFNQFLIEKKQDGFEFIDLTKGSYNKFDVLSQIKRLKKVKIKGGFLSKFFNWKRNDL